MSLAFFIGFMLITLTTIQSCNGIGDDDTCHEKYEDVYKPLYGNCIAYPILKACVEAEMPVDNTAERGRMVARLAAKQPAVIYIYMFIKTERIKETEKER